VIERCTNDHNYSAILRTAEALGIQTVYMIDPPQVIDDDDEESLLLLSQQQQHQQTNRTPQEIEARRQHHLFARNALEWLTVRDFVTTEECVAQLRKDGYQLWVTDLSQKAQSLTFDGGPQIPEKVALVMGTEAVGCSQYMLEQADLRVYLPLRGYADSLNLSVATALILHQLFCMDPTLIGSLTEDEKHTLRQKWYAKLCGQRLLTSAQKKQRQRLLANLKKCQSIQERIELPASDPKSRHVQPAEQKKLDEWDSYKEQLEVLDGLLDPQKVQAAVQEWVDNPPQPLTDVRRADNHRVCYVGKNTRKQHEDHWKDMVATSDSKTIERVTADVFREKVQQQQSS
jgi:tRNA(Leu) C34 or U34 (ribose-2'-O)-methylase TrmL